MADLSPQWALFREELRELIKETLTPGAVRLRSIGARWRSLALPWA